MKRSLIIERLRLSLFSMSSGTPEAEISLCGKINQIVEETHHYSARWW